MTTTFPAATRWFWWCAGIIILSLVPGLFTTLMEPDAALYAGIAKQIVWRNDWVNLFADGKDWLDKPHLPFWISALSFRIFGVSTFAYKLPAFLCWLLGARFTYLFARHFYGEGTAQVAALVYLTALHAIISSNDVRAEPYLTCFLVASSWYLVKAMGNAWNIVPAAFFTGLAMMTKGLFVLIPIGSGMLLHWGMQKDWRQLLQWRWYAYLLLCAVFVLPEIGCLYLQFDMHPEKTVFGRQGVSGVRFFLWESQFGRFFNTGPIKGKGDPFFFLHTLLWAFLPWSLLLYAAFFNRFRKLRGGVEWITLGAGIVTLLVFSLSRFQLPHYLNILFPYFSILLAAWLFELSGWKKVFVTQRTIALIVIVLLAGVAVLFRPPVWWAYMVVSVAAVLVWGMMRKPEDAVRVSVLAAVCVGIFLNVFFYPALVTYQGGSETARWKNKKYPGEEMQFYKINSYSFEFYSDVPVRRNDSSASGLVYTGREGLASLDAQRVPYKTEAIFASYRITRLDGKFVNRATRVRELDSVWVLRIRE